MKTSEKIALFVEANPFATYRQIMTAVGVRSTSVVDHHLKRMKRPAGKEQLDRLTAENKELRRRIGLLAAIEYERDEADRRAGAAERKLDALANVCACLLDSYLCTFEGNKDALAREAERLVPDWKERANRHNPSG